MKKIITLLFVLLLNVSLVACNKNNEQGNAGMPNPMVEYDSLEEINKKVGVKLVEPGVMGVTDEKFYVISDKIAEYDFSLNGLNYCFRASKETNEDISGIYTEEGKPAFEELDTMILLYEDDKYKAERYIINENQYVFMIEDPENTIEAMTFIYQAEEIIDNICLELSDEEARTLVGEYEDVKNDDLEAYVAIFDKNKFLVDIMLEIDENSYDEWVIEASYKNGKLSYVKDDISHYRMTIKDEIIEDYVDCPEDCVDGYFEIKDGKILWTGASSDSMKTTVLEKE